MDIWDIIFGGIFGAVLGFFLSPFFKMFKKVDESDEALGINTDENVRVLVDPTTGEEVRIPVSA